jgi:hypothetical protein
MQPLFVFIITVFAIKKIVAFSKILLHDKTIIHNYYNYFKSFPN